MNVRVNAFLTSIRRAPWEAGVGGGGKVDLCNCLFVCMCKFTLATKESV